MYPIMDESGKVATWLKENGRVYLWESKLIGEPSPNMLTSVDAPPGWRHTESRELTQEDVVFFQKGSAVKTFSSSPAGFKAANKHADKLPQTRPSGMGVWSLRYTVEELCMRSDQTYGTDPARPVHIEFVYAVIMWQALTEPKTAQDGE